MFEEFTEKHNGLAHAVMLLANLVRENEKKMVKVENIKNEVDALNKYIDALIGEKE